MLRVIRCGTVAQGISFHVLPGVFDDSEHRLACPSADEVSGPDLRATQERTVWKLVSLYRLGGYPSTPPTSRAAGPRLLPPLPPPRAILIPRE